MFIMCAYSHFKQSRGVFNNKPKKKKKNLRKIGERNKVNKSKMKPGA